MKAITSLGLAVLLSLGLAACGDDSGDDGSGGSSSTDTGTSTGTSSGTDSGTGTGTGTSGGAPGDDCMSASDCAGFDCGDGALSQLCVNDVCADMAATCP